MRKSTKRFLAILVSMLLCASLAVTAIFACPWDPECPGPDDCHTYETDDGPVLHHLAVCYFSDPLIIEEGDPNYCPGTYENRCHWCDSCGETFYSNIKVPPYHDLVLHCIPMEDGDFFYWECTNCGSSFSAG